MDSKMRLKFWGTRGMISSPRSSTAIFGGNTSCMQVLYKNNLVVVDTGFGVSNLGEALFENALKGINMEIHILFTHFHWDHIQGLPFFHPIYFPTTSLHLYSPLSKENTFENLNILFDGSYSPFAGLKNMPSNIHIHQLQGTTKLGDLSVEFADLDHGGDPEHLEDDHRSFAYKINSPEGESLVIASDHEARDTHLNHKFVEFAKGTDLLVHGAQYTEKEYENKVGWGHSNFRQALDNACNILPNKTILTHHDPSRNDGEIQSIYREYKGKKTYKHLSFEFAREELVYEVQLSKAKKSA